MFKVFPNVHSVLVGQYLGAHWSIVIWLQCSISNTNCSPVFKVCCLLLNSVQFCVFCDRCIQTRRQCSKCFHYTGCFFSLGLPLKFPSTEKLIWARLGVSGTIYVNVDSPNLGFPHFNFLGGYQLKKKCCALLSLENLTNKLLQLIECHRATGAFLSFWPY